MQADRRKALQWLGAGSLAATASALGLGLGHARAQSAQSAVLNYPSKPVRLVVPYPPGGATDVLARALGEPLGKLWQRPVIVENRPGVGGMIGADVVAKAAPDGYTLLLALPSLVQTPYMVAKPPFDPLRDLTAIGQLCTSSLVLTANSAMPRTLPEVVSLAKSQPNKLSYGTYGIGTGAHLYMQVFTTGAGVELLHVPYKGEAPIATDLIGGQISLGTLSPMTVRQHARSGKLQPLAVTGNTRAPMLPDVPTFQELGYKGLDGPAWLGLFTTAGTPQAIVEKISADMETVMAAADIRQRMADLGLIVKTSRPAAFAAVAKADQAYWGNVIKEYNIRLD
ncbi:tripartite tricarboxylate transporter substrate binding protein [Cupriavidus sp. L7L]|uniref:Bug family tripartite tricarboxylate transporter substrate binding protein n=1 Tax=Cupriavidus sp. L7L TaxID=2546443 RepID=UPI001055FA6C|nr:tripartite tricarboxylate transporter substrate binding protein [Cupriavidus sp. L7L]TDF67987.1 tripartite tricarboxylate transporter substrate binding protein [Cupriavidus sp. L7L]